MHKILVCDSAAIVQFVLQRYLKDDEVLVEYAKTPRDLTRMLEHDIPDLIFLEAEIAGGKGRFVCEFLNRRSTTSSIPVILSTRLSDADTHIHELQNWPCVEAVIKKPLSSERVKAEIYRMIRESEAKKVPQSKQEAV